MNAPEELAIELRRGKVLDLQIGGRSYRQIAEQLDISIGTVASDMKALVERARAESDDRLERERMLSLARNGKALGKVLPMLDDDETLKDGVDALDKLEKRRAALLGLDAPTRTEVEATVNTASPTVAARLVRETFGEHAAKRDSAEASPDPDEVPGGTPGG